MFNNNNENSVIPLVHKDLRHGHTCQTDVPDLQEMYGGTDHQSKQ